MLLVLLENAGEVVRKEELIEKVWPDSYVEEGSLARTISMLRKALEEEDEGKTYIATIPKRGYRFVMPVQGSQGLDDPVNGSTDGGVSAPETNRKSPESKRGKSWSGGVLAWTMVLLIASVVVAMVVATRSSRNRIDRRVMILVLPVQNLTGDPSQDYFSDGMTEEIITELGSFNPEQMGVIARTTAMTYQRKQKSIGDIGAELHVDYVLEGSLRESGERVRVAAQLIRTSDQTHLWARNYDRTMKDILALQSDVAQAIAKEVSVQLPLRREGELGKAPAPDPEAYREYIMGRYSLSQRSPEGLRQAVVSFQQAIQRDANYAPAYAGLADAQNLLIYYGLAGREQIPQAEAAARRAIELNDSLAEAHAALGFSLLFWELNWAEAERQLRRAVALNPSDATAHRWYSEYLGALGRTEESLQECRRAVQLDPLSSLEHSTLAFLEYMARHFEAAREEAQIAIELGPNLMVAHATKGLAAMELGNHEDAIRELKRAAELSGDGTYYVAELGAAYARAGRRNDAEQTLRHWDELARAKPSGQSQRAVVLAALGERALALRMLEEAVAHHDDHLIWLKVDPQYDSLRKEARFQAVLQSLGLPNE
jgi:TolB-like protein/Flp pilus assembly protein TadD